MRDLLYSLSRGGSNFAARTISSYVLTQKKNTGIWYRSARDDVTGMLSIPPSAAGRDGPYNAEEAQISFPDARDEC